MLRRAYGLCTILGYGCAYMHRPNWDDYRYILTVAREGGVASAARILGVNHATVLRHIQAFESAHGVVLFDRRASGYELTGHGRSLLEALESLESAVIDVERKVVGSEDRASGVLTITTTDAISVGIIGPYLNGFVGAYPHIAPDLRITNTALDLNQRDADVAIRPSQSPPESLVGRRVGTLGIGVYASRAYAKQYGERRLNEHAWVGLGKLMARSPAARWLETVAKPKHVVLKADSFLTVCTAVEQGLGVALLPCFLGEPNDELVALGPPIDELDTQLWLLTHPDLRRSPLVRAFMDHFGDALVQDAHRLSGRN